MSIPRQLVKSFETISNCKLVLTKIANEDNLKEFGKAMNNAIPDTTNQISNMIYKFMRGMYLSDKQKFIDHIKSLHHYEAMILWTNYEDILTYFDLTNVIFLGWNKTVNKYQVAKIEHQLKNKDTTSWKSESVSIEQSNQQTLNTTTNKSNVQKELTLEDTLPKFVVKDFNIGQKRSPKSQRNKDYQQSTVNVKSEDFVQTLEQNDDYDILYNRIALLQAALEQSTNTAAPIYYTEQDV